MDSAAIRDVAHLPFKLCDRVQNSNIEAVRCVFHGRRNCWSSWAFRSGRDPSFGPYGWPQVNISSIGRPHDRIGHARYAHCCNSLQELTYPGKPISERLLTLSVTSYNARHCTIDRFDEDFSEIPPTSRVPPFDINKTTTIMSVYFMFWMAETSSR